MDPAQSSSDSSTTGCCGKLGGRFCSLEGPSGGEAEGQELDLVVDEGVQEALDALSVHYASSEPETEQPAIVVSVSGVHDFMGYARTLRYLESMDEVDSVDVLGVVLGRVRLSLKLRTGVAGLRELLALSSTLTEDSGNLDGALALRLLP